MYSIAETAAEAKSWLFEAALPLWASKGIDNINGGAFDKIDHDGAALDNNKRCRVQARQIYSFIQAGRLGWQGDWRKISLGLFEFLMTHFCLEKGIFRSHVDLAGNPVSDHVDNYDQAFVIFAMSHLYQVDPSLGSKGIALSVLNQMLQNRKHPMYGFFENDRHEGVLLSNPHMHLLEAALSWADFDEDPIWIETADLIVKLCTKALIKRDAGWIGEVYNQDWDHSTRQARLEPGHQYEWATLLREYAARVDTNLDSLIKRLYQIADRHGVNRDHNLVYSSISPSLNILDANSRCWCQTERIRSAIMMSTIETDKLKEHQKSAIKAWAGLKVFLSSPVPGLWYDWANKDGKISIEPAPASSLYHIIGAISALIETGPHFHNE